MSYYNYYSQQQQQQQQQPNAANLSWFNTQPNYTFSQQGYCTPSATNYQPTYSYSYVVTPSNLASQVFSQIPIDDRYDRYEDIQENSLRNASSMFTESKTTITGSLSSLAKSTTIGTLARERSKSESDYNEGSDSTIVNNLSDMTRSKINTEISDDENDNINDESNKQLATRITPHLFDNNNNNRKERNRDRDRDITTEGVVSVIRRLTELSKLTRRDGMNEKQFVHAIHNCILDRETARNIFTQLSHNRETLKISDLFTDVASLIRVIEDVILEARLSSGSRLY
jgi:hypothetical protein